jgi:allophycocyanin-B
MSVVRDLIIQADDQLRYPTGGELRSIVEFLSGGNARLSVVRVLTDNEKKIVDEAARQLFSRKPEYVAPGGNAFGQKQRAQCLRDFSWYLRLVTYGVLAGSTERIQEIGLLGAREMYNSLGVPMPGMVEAIRHTGAAWVAGVQWHPERTKDPVLGLGMVKKLVDAAAAARNKKENA